jgi:uncharacterized membrane protein
MKLRFGNFNFGARRRRGRFSSTGVMRSSRFWHGTGAGRILPVALAGGVLLYRGISGRWPLANLFGGNGNAERPHPATSVPHETGIKVERSVLINKAPGEIYRFWRDLENLPRFMTQHVAVDTRAGEPRSHWQVKSLAGKTFEWDAEIINDIPDQLLAWRSLEGADLDHAGSVHFEATEGDKTKVSVILEYRPPAGKLGAGVARLFGQEPSQVIDKDLQRLKQLLEGGEVGENR